MTRMGALLIRATAMALLLLTLFAGVASADPGTGNPNRTPAHSPTTAAFPDDPGFIH